MIPDGSITISGNLLYNVKFILCQLPPIFVAFGAEICELFIMYAVNVHKSTLIISFFAKNIFKLIISSHKRCPNWSVKKSYYSCVFCNKCKWSNHSILIIRKIINKNIAIKEKRSTLWLSLAILGLSLREMKICKVFNIRQWNKRNQWSKKKIIPRASSITKAWFCH